MRTLLYVVAGAIGVVLLLDWVRRGDRQGRRGGGSGGGVGDVGAGGPEIRDVTEAFRHLMNQRAGRDD